MTPLICEMFRIVPEPELCNWFDASDLTPDQSINLDVVNETPLPYKQCAIVGRQGDAKWLVMMRRQGDVMAYTGWTLDHSRYETHPAFTYVCTPEGLRVSRLDDKGDMDVIRGLLATVGAWLQALSPKSVAHFPTPKKSLINTKRAARGKGPILFDWHTVTIEPPKRSIPMGGTHATPRRHQCRGHWRNCKSGKRVWVKDCWRGDASKGVVFKDYKV